MRIGDLEMLLQTGKLGWDGSMKWGSPGMDGRKYNWHGFGQQLIVLPFYLFTRLTAYGYYAVNILSTALTCVLLMRMLQLLGFARRASALTGMTYGIATLAWYYAAKTPHEHALAIFTVIAGTYYAVKYGMGLGRRHLLISAAFIGFGFLVRHDVIIGVLPISAYILMKRKESTEKKFSIIAAVLLAALVFVPFLAAESYYNYLRFGDVFETGYAGSTGAPERLFGVEFIPSGLIGAYLSPGKSVFLFSPALFLFPFYIKRFKQKTGREFFALSVVAAAAYSLFYASHHSWDGDWCFGPRYFLVVVPFMVMPLAVMFEEWGQKKTLKKVLLVSVIAVSVFVQITFVSSNAYMSSVMRFGISDDSLPDLSNQTGRYYGVHGSWQWLWSYFPLKHAQFVNQLRIFAYTALIMADGSNIFRVSRWLYELDSPFVMVYFEYLTRPDLWWFQDPAGVQGRYAAPIALVGLLALIQTVRLSRP